VLDEPRVNFVTGPESGAVQVGECSPGLALERSADVGLRHGALD